MRRRRTGTTTYAFRVPAEDLDDLRIRVSPAVNGVTRESADWAASLTTPPEDLLDDSLIREPVEQAPAEEATDEDHETEHTPKKRKQRRQEKRDHRRQQIRSTHGAAL